MKPSALLAVAAVLCLAPSPPDPGTVVCHRGDRSGGRRDNSAEAFRAAVDAGFGFECDIRLDARGRVVCAHGADDDAANATTFAEALSFARDGCWIVADVKGDDISIASAARSVVEAQSVATPSNLFFICTDLAFVRAFREQLPRFKTMWLTGCALDGDFPERAMTADEMIRRLRGAGASGVTLSDRAEVFTDEYLAKVASAGFEMHLCTYESLSGVRDAFRRGAKTVTVNNAHCLRSVVLDDLAKDAAGSVRASLQAAIDRISASGGATVVLPPGRYTTGSVRLRDNISLCLADGARLVGDLRPSEYAPCKALLFAEGARNVGVEGAGVVEKGLLFDGCRQVCVAGIAVEDAASRSLCLKDCIDVTVRGVSFRGGASGVACGIDMGSSWVLVENCRFDSEENAVRFTGESPGFEVRNVAIRGCNVPPSRR